MSAKTPRVTTPQTFECQISARCCTVSGQSLQSVDRTGGFKTARRSQPRAQQKTICLNAADQKGLHHVTAIFSNNCVSSALTACLSASEEALTKCLRSNPVLSRTT